MKPKASPIIPHGRVPEMMTSLVTVVVSLRLASRGADFHTDFTEASLGDITGLNKVFRGRPLRIST